MWIHVSTLVAYAGFYLVIVFLTLGIACALFYLAELIEEYTSLTKRLISNIVKIELVLHALLILDRLPFLCLATSTAAQVACLTLLKQFPYNQLTAPNSLVTAGLTLSATALWVRHFWQLQYSIEYVVAFCLVTVWLVPFTLLLGVTGDQSALPGASGFPYPTPTPGQVQAAPKKQSRRGLALQLFDMLRRKRDDVMPTLTSHLPGVTKEKM